MIGKFFTKCCFVIVFFSLGLSNRTLSQPFNITTNYNTSSHTFISDPNSGFTIDFISFDLYNNGACTLDLKEVGMYHAGELIFNNGYVLSQNEATYTLWYSRTNTTGYPDPINAGNGWTQLNVSDPINTGTTNVVAKMFDTLNLLIFPFSKVRFVISCSDTMAFAQNSTPLSFTNPNGNVTLLAGSANDIYIGDFPNASFNTTNITPPPTTLNFDGYVTYDILPAQRPDVTLVPSSGNVCWGDSVRILASHQGHSNDTFILKDPSGAILGTNTTGIFDLKNMQANQTGNYEVTVIHCGIESIPRVVRIVVRKPPKPTVDGKFKYCLNERFEPLTVNGTNPKWYYDSTGGSPIPVTPTINTATPNVLFYYVSQTDQYGCESERTRVRLSAAVQPDTPIVESPIYYCEGDPADQLTAIGDTLLWYYQQNGGIPTEIAPTPNTSKRDSFKYYVTQTIDGCESERGEIDVVVTFRPNGLILVDKELICSGDSVVIDYYGSAFPGAAYNWTLPPGVTVLNPDTAFDQGPLRIRIDQPGTRRINLQVGVKGCMSEVYEETVDVNPLPTGVIYSKDNLCLGQDDLISMTSYTPTTDTFTWDFDGGLTTHFTTDQGPYGVYWTTPGKKVISVTLQDSGCISVIKDSLIVHAKPDASFKAERFIPNGNILRNELQIYNIGDSLCTSDSMRFEANTIEPGSIYTWSPASFFNENASNNQPVSYARARYSSDVILHVEDEFGCENTDTVEVLTRSCCEMWFPTAFTPNNDGTNDFFHPETNSISEVKTFQVMNRYGQIVYQSTTYDRGWDGMLNGNPQDVGTYFYLISFMCDGELTHQKGEVTLLR